MGKRLRLATRWIAAILLLSTPALAQNSDDAGLSQHVSFEFAIGSQPGRVEITTQEIDAFSDAEGERILKLLATSTDERPVDLVFLEADADDAQAARSPTLSRGLAQTENRASLLKRIQSFFGAHNVESVDVKTRLTLREKFKRWWKDRPNKTATGVTYGTAITIFGGVIYSTVFFGQVPWWHAAGVTAFSMLINVVTRVYREAYENGMMYSWWSDNPRMVEDAYPNDIRFMGMNLGKMSKFVRGMRRNLLWAGIRWCELLLMNGANGNPLAFTQDALEKLFGVQSTQGFSDALYANARDKRYGERKKDPHLSAAFTFLVASINSAFMALQMTGVPAATLFTMGAFKFTTWTVGAVVTNLTAWLLLKYVPKVADFLSEKLFKGARGWNTRMTLWRKQFKSLCESALLAARGRSDGP